MLEQIQAEAADLRFVFVSSKRDLDAVARAVAEAGDGPTICCTTAGEISGGHVEQAVVGAALSGVRAEVWTIEQLDRFDENAAMQLAERMQPFLDGVAAGESVAAVVVLDGLARAEERVTAHLHHALGGIPMVGGSAGDELAFEHTYVLADGAFRENVGAIALIATSSPTTTFMTHHFEPTEERLVVTAADPATRRVMELDGRPAAETLRMVTGLPDEPLSKEAMAVHPLMLAIGDRTYVRSLAGEVDGALELYCSIEEGLVLRIGRPTDLQASLVDAFAAIEARVGEPQLVLGFDCVLRRLEMQLFDTGGCVLEALAGRPFCGFSTYGEVFGGLHVNQTLTGLAFGR
ncbi:MAG: FIST C-terminal domain-containing protein [Planctomycetes bacterium]|nr:FIST C-terminal domain-containing protein [Planctomycetota bacterium]